MSAVVRLDADARAAALPGLGEAGWGAVPERDAIRKIWRFRSFSRPGASCRAWRSSPRR